MKIAASKGVRFAAGSAFKTALNTKGGTKKAAPAKKAAAPAKKASASKSASKATKSTKKK